MKLSLRRAILPKLLELLDKRGNSKLSKAERSAAEEELIEKVRTDPDWGASLRIIGHYVHGTHVAGLAVHGQDSKQLRLITAPVFSKQGFEAFSTGWLDILGSFSNPHGRQNSDEITRAISEQQVKVVNMSFGSRWGGSIEQTMEAEIPLFKSNPDTVFVVAAGNSSTDLSGKKGQDGEIFPESKVKNVLFVGALDEAGDLAEFSDYGTGVVHIAAPGTSIGSSIPDENIMHLDGTSMASPIVANRVAQVRLQHPELSASDAIQHVLHNETYTNSSLSGKITEGRCLKMNADVRTFDQMDHETILELRRFVGHGL